MHDVACTALSLWDVNASLSSPYLDFLLNLLPNFPLNSLETWMEAELLIWNINCCPLIQSEPAKSIYRAVSEFILGQFLWLGWHISVVFRCMFSHPPTRSQDIWEVPVWVLQNLFFFNCVLDDCSWWEAVNHPKPSNQFDLFLPSLSSSCLRSKLFTEFILKVPLGRLVKQKLDCLIDIVHSDLFTHHGESTHTHTHRTKQPHSQFFSARTFTHGAVI